MIIDTVKIYLRAGRGGEGSSSFLRVSPSVLRGYGGDGGKGADIIIRTNRNLYDLSKFKGTKKFIASNGVNGRENNKRGKDAEGLMIDVPLGTRVLEEDTLIVDMVSEDSAILICRGGKGGKGNYKRKQTFPPYNGEEKHITLDYRIPNDVAILGVANSGKTALFNALTGQKRKVAEYPFTTSSCFWAKSEYGFKEFTVLDTPPFKESKSGPGLSENMFLRHIFRSKILLLLSDDPDAFGDGFARLKRESSFLEPDLLKGKKIFHLLSKVDTIDNKATAKNTFQISVKEAKKIEKLKAKIIKELGI